MRIHPLTILQEVAAIELILEQSNGAVPDPKHFNRIHGHLTTISAASGAARALQEKVGTARHFSEVLFSPEKHRRYGGIGSIRVILRYELGGIRKVAETFLSR